jgi:hypothetical protein
LIIGIGTDVPSDFSLRCSTKPRRDTEMIAQFADLLDRTALTVFLTVAAVPVFAFPLLAVAGIH